MNLIKHIINILTISTILGVNFFLLKNQNENIWILLLGFLSLSIGLGLALYGMNDSLNKRTQNNGDINE